jgi:hypothetical protein
LASAVTLYTTDGNGADHYVSENAPDSIRARDHRLFVRRSNTEHQISFIRFDLSSITETISDATIELSLLTTASFDLGLYGVNDDPSEVSAMWTPNTITYNNAPGTSPSDAPSTEPPYTTTLNLDLTKVTALGTYPIAGVAVDQVGETRSLNSAAIMDFINADTNGLVTFILTREPNGGATNQFRSSRPRSTDPPWRPTEHAPRIEITTGVVAQPGDFDGDGDVDGADFVAWQTNFPTASGATLAQGDADADGDVDGADFVVWQTNFPFTPGPGAAPVPEPRSCLLLAICGMLALVWSRTQSRP